LILVSKEENLPHGDFFIFDIEQGGRPPPEKKRKTNLMKQGGRSLPEIKKKDQFDAVFYMKV
jgi:hypothetical protein